jgi:ribosomal protein S27AE
MPTSHAHATRLYRGEAEATQLSCWLEKTQGTARNRRVDRLIRLIHRLLSTFQFPVHVQYEELLPRKQRSFPIPSLTKEAEELSGELRRCLAAYRFSPTFVCVSSTGSAIMYWRPVGRVSKDFLDDQGQLPYGEAQAVSDIVHMAEIGCIDRVRRCLNCGKWFFAQFLHRWYCTSKCQQKAYRATPTYKQNKRDYMRKNRLQHKERLFRSTSKRA